MNKSTRRILFELFFVSGFCGLAYQVIWIRMAFATFGIIAPVMSVVISVFMLGLSVGSWAGGRYINSLVTKSGLSPAAFYAGAEFIIGLGAFAVPWLFKLGGDFLLSAGQTNSFGYLLQSGVVLALSILPWCFCMGMTFPFMMAYVREQEPENTGSFSFLYLANVLGAMSGTLLTAVVLVEVLGFRHTLWLAALGNFSIALVSAFLARGPRGNPAPPPAVTAPAGPLSTDQSTSRCWIKWVLFSTGFCVMAMEVIWARAFAPIVFTQVYSFASVVFTYLGATFIGSWLYRKHLRHGRTATMGMLFTLLVLSTFLPILLNDPRVLNYGGFRWSNVLIMLGSICPLCALLGYLTPGLIDQFAGGDPAGAGKAYAINVLGCILGPLVASYILLPYLGERHSLVVLTLPFFALLFPVMKQVPRWQRWASGLTAFALLIDTNFFTIDYEGAWSRSDKRTEIRHDYAASVIAAGTGFNSQLMVNGICMTSLTPITKFMVHLPLAFHQGPPPKSALLICFGMGTSYRSALSWDIDTTIVELVPSVPKSFGYFHADATNVLRNPRGHIVIDDGRRYLKRTRDKYDIIVIDPPPPVEAAGSSLLYSQQFYDLAKLRLKTNGILQAWFPGGPRNTAQAIYRSIHDSFPYVLVYDSVEGWGTHFLASMQPIPELTAAQLAMKMPPAARKDLLEWYSAPNLTNCLQAVLVHKVNQDKILEPNPNVRVTDDHPFNEYFLLRKNRFYAP